MTKLQRLNKQREILRKMVVACAFGAHGAYQPLDLDAEFCAELPAEMGVEKFGHFVGALKNLFAGQLEKKDYVLAPHSYKHFHSIDSIVDWLFKSGVRP